MSRLALNNECANTVYTVNRSIDKHSSMVDEVSSYVQCNPLNFLYLTSDGITTCHWKQAEQNYLFLRFQSQVDRPRWVETRNAPTFNTHTYLQLHDILT